jgi:hypothetical protein
MYLSPQGTLGLNKTLYEMLLSLSTIYFIKELLSNKILLPLCVLDLTDSRQSLVSILDWRMQSDATLEQSDL